MAGSIAMSEFSRAGGALALARHPRARLGLTQPRRPHATLIKHQPRNAGLGPWSRRQQRRSIPWCWRPGAEELIDDVLGLRD